jgi:hypothetical protein
MKTKPPEKIQKATSPSTRGHWNEMNRKQRREMMRQIQSEDLSLEVVHPHAAGIDIGNESHYVAVPPTRDSQPVRHFGCTTVELKALPIGCIHVRAQDPQCARLRLASY